MKPALLLVAGLSLWLALSGCLADSHAGSDRPSVSEVVGVAEAGSDVGDARPLVSYDGLMIRRRETVALRTGAAVDVRGFVRDLTRAAGDAAGVRLSVISPDVLDAAELERMSPAVVLSLPAGASPAQSRDAMRLALSTARRDGLRVRDHAVERVLVHDLRFTVPTAHAAQVARAITREGILSDALGPYTALRGARRLDLLYTGPLLSDRLLLSVRQGIARAASVGVRAVTVTPRSSSGHGVFLADEPTPPAATFGVSDGAHQHH